MPLDPGCSDSFRRLIEAIVSGDTDQAVAVLEASPRVAHEAAARGATRATPQDEFFEQIAHYLYRGDTALHMAAAAKRAPIVELLITIGAEVSACNRRGAEPLHYATDGGPGSPTWNPDAHQGQQVGLDADAAGDRKYRQEWVGLSRRQSATASNPGYPPRPRRELTDTGCSGRPGGEPASATPGTYERAAGRNSCGRRR
jgi:hypothetical protein